MFLNFLSVLIGKATLIFCRKIIILIRTVNCSRPQYIPKPGLYDRPSSQRLLNLQKPLRNDFIVVPCGKCSKCLRNRQDSFSCRIRAEADKRGSMAFLTLTYNDDNLPLVSTVWKVDKLTGEMSRITEPDFVCYSRKDDYFMYRQEMREIKPSRFPRYIDIPFFEDDDSELIYRITPSVCRKDVQSWLKACRHYCERVVGRRAEFSYAICSEYGPRTCRPHYHCIFFGLDPDTVHVFANLWKYGFVDVKIVPRVNVDGSDAFTKVSEYVGKYVSKGVFECDSVKCGASSGTRMMSSKGLGDSIVEKFRDYACAFDVVGCRYDLDSFWIADKRRYLNRNELQKLSYEIPKRLAISFDGKRYFALPRVLRNKIFYVKTKSKEGDTSYYRPSRVWKMVVDALSQQYADIHKQEFEQFLSGYSPGKIREAVASFNEMCESSAKLADDVGNANYKAKLSKSIF